MNTNIPTVPGTPFAGGFYAGCINIQGQAFALIVAPKDGGEKKSAWHSTYDPIPSTTSVFDGLTNTQAMADAGSELATWARGLRIGDHDDWYLPSQDELEIIYRNLKPTTEENYLYMRSGINVSALPPTYPYTPDQPAQTAAEAFQTGGAEAFDPAWYWTSTQHAADSDDAWVQYFDDGSQDYYCKDCSYRARAVRRFSVI